MIECQIRADLQRASSAIACVVLLIVPLLLAGCGGAAASEPNVGSDTLGLMHPGYLTVGTLSDNPPMEEESPPHSGRYRGADIALARALVRAMHLRVRFVNDSWSALIPDLLRGRKFDVIIADMNDTPARRQMIDFVDYMRAEEGILVWKSSSIYASGYEWLCGDTVATPGNNTVEYSQLKAAAARCSPTSSTQLSALSQQARCPQAQPAKQKGICIRYAGDTFAQFLRHPTWAYTTDLPITDFYLRQNSRKLRYAGTPIRSGENYGIGVSIKNPSLENTLFAAVGKIMASGEYRIIIDRWGLGKAAY